MNRTVRILSLSTEADTMSMQDFSRREKNWENLVHRGLRQKLFREIKVHRPNRGDADGVRGIC